MSISPEFQAMLDQSSEQMREYLELMQQMTQDNIDANGKQFIVQEGQKSINDAVEDSYKGAAEHVLQIQAQTHADLERAMGAPEDPFAVNSWKSAHEVRQNAPKVGGSNPYEGMSPLQELKENIRILESIVTLLDNGGSPDSFTDEMNSFLAEHGIDPNDEGAIRSALENAQADLAAIENFLGPDPDVEGFLDALGERAGAYKADADAYAEAYQHTQRMEKIMEKVADYEAALADMGMEANPEAYPLTDFLSASDISYLQEHGVNPITLETVQQAYTDAKEAEADAYDRLLDRSTDPVSADDADPSNGNQFEEDLWPSDELPFPDTQSAEDVSTSSAMATASAELFGEDEDDLDAVANIL